MTKPTIYLDLPQAQSDSGVHDPDLEVYLQKKRLALRDQRTVRRLTTKEQRIADDILWAQSDPEVQAKHRGEFVVPWEHKVKAHGLNCVEVLREAAQIIGCSAEELPLIGIVDPILDVSNEQS